jgi:hypothetical protein
MCHECLIIERNRPPAMRLMNPRESSASDQVAQHRCVERGNQQEERHGHDDRDSSTG